MMTTTSVFPREVSVIRRAIEIRSKGSTRESSLSKVTETDSGNTSDKSSPPSPSADPVVCRIEFVYQVVHCAAVEGKKSCVAFSLWDEENPSRLEEYQPKRNRKYPNKQLQSKLSDCGRAFVY